MSAAGTYLSPELLRWCTIKSLSTPYFQDLIFDDFDEYAYCVHHEDLHDAMKYNPPAWFVTIDQDQDELEPEIMPRMDELIIERKLLMYLNERSLLRTIDLFKKVSFRESWFGKPTSPLRYE